jgi:hypothetical protein
VTTRIQTTHKAETSRWQARVGIRTLNRKQIHGAE